MKGQRYYLWQVVDQEGNILDIWSRAGGKSQDWPCSVSINPSVTVHLPA